MLEWLNMLWSVILIKIDTNKLWIYSYHHLTLFHMGFLQGLFHKGGGQPPPMYIENQSLPWRKHVHKYGPTIE